MKVDGKVVVVTGAGSGIGRQLVLELISRGASVAAGDINSDSLAETRELANAGERVMTAVVDISDRTRTSEFPAEVEAALGSPDAVINNAGIIQPFVRLNELEFETIERVFDINFYGTLNMVKAFLPGLLERPVAHLANVASMGAFLPVPGQTIYGASKAAVKLMTEGLYAELLETNVGVSVIMPGAVATNITENSGVDAPISDEEAEQSSYRTTSAEDAAKVIVDGIEDDQLHIYVGRDSLFMNLANRLAPKRSTHLIQRQMKDLLA